MPIKKGVMREVTVQIKGKKKVKPDVFLLEFQASRITKIARPGQFLHIKIDDDSTVLRRPISIHAINCDIVSLLVRVRGKGTLTLSNLRKGDRLNVLGPLGNGFRLADKKKKGVTNILVGGGMGVAPLIFLAQKLAGNPRNIAIVGAANKGALLCEKELKNLGWEVVVATDDGSKGVRGNVADVLRGVVNRQDSQMKKNIYACGPEVMFGGIYDVIQDRKDIFCQVSYEQFMGCGTGICCGCTIETKLGYKKVCKDGPVFDINAIW